MTSDLIDISTEALDLLMPLHLRVSETGVIAGAGPTFLKLCTGLDIAGLTGATDGSREALLAALQNLRFLDLFEVKRPRNIRTFAKLHAQGACRIRLLFRSGPGYTMKGLFTPLSDGAGGLINLSLGISVGDAVARFQLSSADFAPSDPTVDMLYLIEANAAAMTESKRLNQRLHGAKAEAEEKAHSDTLTGLKNRRAMDGLLTRLARMHTPFGLMHMDLDYFKQVNDTLGHAAGDFVLQEVASVLSSEIRADDMVARVGGDEFVMIFNNCVDLDVLGRIASRIIERLEEPMEFEGETCRISASIGTTLSSFYDVPKIDQMLSDADRALYHSKNRGRAQHTVYQPDMMAS
ncbi:GGDEF domain-containing protein [Litoreibacter roseus]|uniref:GGDEF domain-containing protein n=1 Tax=Litoreibacter roseus TaxID=2601869 RepID=A0A6N6JJH8_9RHOB|nr:GGDEF domain-containing protein [Litoreibacter roseus]GFE65428.1 GGDEF domain-containing protein [Litoreibacter roseus]